VTHRVYYNSWLPNASVRYRIKDNWSAYAQFAEGSSIPPSSVFDVPGAAVLVPPNPTLAKTYQLGSVIKSRRWTLDTAFYYVHFQNANNTYLDITSLLPVSIATGPTNTKGLEAESNIVLGWGFSVYLNGTIGSAKYQTGANYPNGGKWVQNTPHDVEAINLVWRRRNWDVGLVEKRVGTLYNDNGSLPHNINGLSLPVPVNEAVKIDPFNIVNVFV